MDKKNKFFCCFYRRNIISKPTEVEDDHVLREFHNSLYESADHTQASATAPEYYMPRHMNVEQPPDEICNPTYGLCATQRHATNTPTLCIETSVIHDEPHRENISAEALYSEVTAGREANVYDVPGWQ